MGKGKDNPGCQGPGMEIPYGGIATAEQILAEQATRNGYSIMEEYWEERNKRFRAVRQLSELNRKEQAKAERRAQVESMLAQLEDNVQHLAEHPEELEEWLESMAAGRLWQYSFNNLWLARAQARGRDFEISRLASKTRWAELGYRIKKGERALKILRPVTKSVWVDKTDASGKPLLDAEGKPQKRRVNVPVRGEHGQPIFETSNTWDISQMTPMTDADGTPVSRALDPPTPSSEQALAELTQIAEEQGVQVFLGAVDDPDFAHRAQLNMTLASRPDAEGFYTEIGPEDSRQRVIVTRSGLGARAQAQVLAHELAHALLHAGQRGYQDHDDRMRKEVEAEGTAYVLCQHYGLESKEQAAYVAHWARGREAEALKGAMGNIQRAVKTVLGRAEELQEAA